MAVKVKRTAIAAGIIAAAIALIILAYAGLFLLMSGGMRAKIDEQEKRLANLEKQLAVYGAASSGAKKSSSKTGSTSKENPYEGWETYENAAVGYTLKYPSTWKLQEAPPDIDGKPVQPVVFVDQDNLYYVAVAFRKKGSDVIITGRPGKTPGKTPGKMKASGSITVLGASVKRTGQVVGNRYRAYFYPGATGLFSVGGYEGYAEFAKRTATEKYNLKGTDELAMAELIISSLAIIPTVEAAPVEETAPADETPPAEEAAPAEETTPTE